MYAALGTRPDITHTVSVHSQFSSCPTQEYRLPAKRVLRYLKGTTDCRLRFRRDREPLRGFVDAEWANSNIDRRSYTGSVFILSGAAITWKSREQRTVALSSIEAEYMAITNAAKEALHIINFLRDLGHPELANAIIFNDNQGAGKLAENPVFHSRSIETHRREAPLHMGGPENAPHPACLPAHRANGRGCIDEELARTRAYEMCLWLWIVIIKLLQGAA